MFLTHHFGSVETLVRARNWLAHHGIEIACSDSAEHDETRLVMSLPLSRVSAALALIDSIERADSRGWPGLFELSKTFHVQGPHSGTHSEELATMGTSTPIHWQDQHEDSSTDPHCCKVSEYMFGHHE